MEDFKKAGAKRWTPSQDAWLAAHWGESLSSLGRHLGLSREAVRIRAKRLGLAPRKARRPKLKPPLDNQLDNQFLRRCHDCGKPTTQYRCPECTKKWRLKNGVENIDSGYGGL